MHPQIKNKQQKEQLCWPLTDYDAQTGSSSKDEFICTSSSIHTAENSTQKTSHLKALRGASAVSTQEKKQLHGAALLLIFWYIPSF